MSFAQPVTVTMEFNETDNRTNVRYTTLRGLDRGLQLLQRKFAAANDGFSYCKVFYRVEWPDGSVATFRQDVERTGEVRYSRIGCELMRNYVHGPGVTKQHRVYKALTGLDSPPVRN